jgi:hypothetical protein
MTLRRTVPKRSPPQSPTGPTDTDCVRPKDWVAACQQGALSHGHRRRIRSKLPDRALEKLEEACEKIEMAKQCRLEREARRAEKRTASKALASSF